MVLTDIVPGTRGEEGSSLGLKGDFTDSQGNSQGTVFLKPGEDPYIVEVSYSDESQLEHFSEISFVSNGYELWWNSTDGHHWHLGDVVAFIRLTSSNKIEDRLHESDKRLNFVCIREQSNGINPLFAAITNHDGYKCGGSIYPAYETIRSSHFTPDEAQAGMIRNLMAGRWDAFVNDFKAHYFALKAQKAIDKLWDEGVINEETIEQWGEEHMRTPYGYEAHRS